MQGRQGSHTTSLRFRSGMTTKQRAGMAFIGGVVEGEHISEGLQISGISAAPVDTLTLDGAPGLAGRHRSGHGCSSYHSPMMAAVTITSLDSGILLVSIPNVPAVVSLLLFIFFLYILMGNWGRVREPESEDGHFKAIPWRWKLCWKSRVSHISQQQRGTWDTAPGLQDLKSSRRQEKNDWE